MSGLDFHAFAEEYYANKDPTLRGEDKVAYDTCSVCGEHCHADQLIRLPTGDRICHGCFQDAYDLTCLEYQEVTKTLGSFEKDVLIMMLKYAPDDVITRIWGNGIE